MFAALGRLRFAFGSRFATFAFGRFVAWFGAAVFG
jgi:hypothetical protein